MRLPLSVGKERLIFTFQARALSNYRGLVPCLRSGERKLQAARLETAPTEMKMPP